MSETATGSNDKGLQLAPANDTGHRPVAVISLRERVSGIMAAAAQSYLFWCIVIAVVIAIRTVLFDPTALLTSLGDTDDATRLVEVRHLLATGAWFDMTLPHFGGPDPLVSHWSRLIDAALIVHLKVFGLFLSPGRAELAMRAVWPVLLLAATLGLVAREAAARAGWFAGLFVPLLAFLCPMSVVQFLPGRIDHHNVQILGAVAGLLMLARSTLDPRAGAIAGVLLGLGFAVGFEGFGIVLPGLAASACLGLYDPRYIEGPARAAVAFAATTAVALVATVAPSQWLQPGCDVLGANMVALAAFGAAGLILVARHGRELPLAARVGTVAATSAIGVFLFGLMEPVCFKGPFAQVDPAIVPIWLEHVSETRNIIQNLGTHTTRNVALIVFLMIGLGAQLHAWRTTRGVDDALVLLTLTLAISLGFWQSRLLPYACLLAVFTIAVLIARLPASSNLPLRTMRLIGLSLMNQTTVMVAVSSAMAAVASTTPAASRSATATSIGDKPSSLTECTATPAMQALSLLPTGHFVADIDLGAYIVALSPHSVLSAPYHRLNRAILATHTVMNATPEAARQQLDDLEADYFATCLDAVSDPRATMKPGVTFMNTLPARLADGEIFSWLVPVAVEPKGSYLRVWRVVR